MTAAQDPAIWISESDVVSMMGMGEAIAALETGLQAEAQGDAQNMIKTHVEWGGGATLHAIGAVFPKHGFAGTKTWPHTKNGATPLLILFDSNKGTLKAILEAFALGQLRTAAASGVATQRLASAGASEFAIIGTGKQAITQVAAVLAVRPIRRMRVFSPNEERRTQFVMRARNEFGVEVVGASSVREAVKSAQIITMATRATVSSDVLARSTQIVTDSIPQAQKLSRELIEFFGSQPGNWDTVRSLASVVGSSPGRTAGDDLTLFKSLGVGVSDLSLGIALYKRAVELGLGQRIPHPQKVSPRLRTTQLTRTPQGG